MRTSLTVKHTAWRYHLTAMEALCVGGPLDGQLLAVQGEPLYWHVAKPSEPMHLTSWFDPALPPTIAIRGTYRRCWWNDGYGNITPRFEWIGWESEDVLLDPPVQFTLHNDGTRGWSLGDEPGPDAMRWRPEDAEAEISEWRRILDGS